MQPFSHSSRHHRRRRAAITEPLSSRRQATSSEMPALRSTDSADLEAKAPRAELGFSRQLKQPRRVAPHPFLGGTGYPVWYREQQLEK